MVTVASGEMLVTMVTSTKGEALVVTMVTVASGEMLVTMVTSNRGEACYHGSVTRGATLGSVTMARGVTIVMYPWTKK